MDRIKSSYELAMEKLKTRGNNGTERAMDHESGEYVKAATILGRSYMQGVTSKEEIGEKLNRYPEHSRPAAVRALIRELLNKITLDSTPMVLEIIKYIKEDDKTEETCSAAEEIYRQYRNIREEKLALLAKKNEQKEREKLALSGIKGNAIAGFNVKGTATWQQLREQTEKEYMEALEPLCNSLIQDAANN